MSVIPTTVPGRPTPPPPPPATPAKPKGEAERDACLYEADGTATGMVFQQADPGDLEAGGTCTDPTVTYALPEGTY